MKPREVELHKFKAPSSCSPPGNNTYVLTHTFSDHLECIIAKVSHRCQLGRHARSHEPLFLCLISTFTSPGSHLSPPWHSSSPWLCLPKLPSWLLFFLDSFFFLFFSNVVVIYVTTWSWWAVTYFYRRTTFLLFRYILSQLQKHIICNKGFRMFEDMNILKFCWNHINLWIGFKYQHH